MNEEDSTVATVITTARKHDQLQSNSLGSTDIPPNI